MIKFRQREYSSNLGLKLVRGLKRGINKTDTAITNSSLKTKDKIEELFGLSKLKPKTAKVRVPEKSKFQINKETLGVRDTGRKIINTPINEGIDNGIRFAAGNPMTAAGSLVPIPGGTAVGMVGDKFLKSGSLDYSVGTYALQDGYSKSKFSRYLRRKKLPSISELIKK